MTHDSPAEKPTTQLSESGIRFDNCVDARAATGNAVALALTSANAWSLTQRQLEVFRQLCNLQMEHAGPHSLLPQVVTAFLAVARRPWWDCGVAGLSNEPGAYTDA